MSDDQMMTIAKVNINPFIIFREIYKNSQNP